MFKFSIKGTINFIVILTIFLDRFILVSEPFKFYYYYFIYIIFILLYLAAKKNFHFNRSLAVILAVLVTVGIGTTILNGFSLAPIFKQLTNIFLSSSVFYLLFRINNFDFSEIFKSYLSVALLICSIGVLQELLYLLGLYHWGYAPRVTSIVYEPANLAIAISPAMFVALNKLFLNNTELLSKPKSYILLIAYCLTLSGVALLGLIIAFGLLVLSRFKYIFSGKNIFLIITIIACIPILLYFAYQFPGIKLRIDDTIMVITGTSRDANSNMNLSTFALYSNYLVARESFLNNGLFGSGLGTHHLNYDLYIDKLFSDSFIWKDLKINRMDGASLFIRLLSETGLMGLIFLVVFIFKNFVKYEGKNEMLIHCWLINNATLVFFMLRIIRFGNYTVLGFFLFVFMYYFSAREVKSIR